MKQILAKLTFRHAFIRLGLHHVVQPFTGSLMRLLYRTEFSRWRVEQGELGLNDFFSPVFCQDDRLKLYEHVLQTEGLDQPINYLEFGVASGGSIKWWAEHNTHPSSTFVGFDTFTGLPEEFGKFPKGDFSTDGKLPDIKDPRVSFKAGLFQDTLPSFISEHPFEHRLVLHIDADLYSSTLFALTSLAQKLKKNDILLFDEFSTATHEFRAFVDFAHAYGFDYKVLGAVNNYLQVAMKVL